MKQEDLQQAYLLLGVNQHASQEEVRNRYRELAREAHPDQGGSDAEMAELADAYALIRSVHRGDGNDLVAASSNVLVHREPVDLLRKEELREDSKRVFDAAIRHRTFRLKQAKRQGTWAAVGSAGIGLIIALLKTLGLDSVQTREGDEVWLTSTTRLMLVIVCLGVSGIFAFLAWRASVRSIWIESALEDLADHLSDKNSYFRLMQHLQKVGLPERWTRDDLILGVSRWSGFDEEPSPGARGRFIRDSGMGLLFPHTHRDGIPLEAIVRAASPADSANLIIAKGMERGLISEQRSSKEGYGYAYTLVF
jgi:DnaJ domain